MQLLSLLPHLPRWGLLLAAVLAAGCAGRQPLVPQVRSAAASDGSTVVAVAPEPLVCQAGPRCPLLSASWASAHPGQAALTVALPGARAAVSGADIHIGGSQVLRLRLPVPPAAPVASDAVPAAVAPAPADTALGPASRFDVPLRLIDQLAHAPRSWMRVHLADGSSVDEHIHSGELRSRASEAMAHFLAAVQAAGGQGAGLDGPRGGLFDRLGVRESGAAR